MIALKHRSIRAPAVHPLANDASLAARRCRRKFLRYFPGGFYDQTYLGWERDYKVEAHNQWEALLNRARLRTLLKAKNYQEIASAAVRVESRTRHSMLFSFEKMALRDAVRSIRAAELFARGIFNFLHGEGSSQERFEQWCDTVAALPRKQTRVLTWPMVTVFGFIARPQTHIFLKPRVTRLAAEAYGFDFPYHSRPNWTTYSHLLAFAETIRKNLCTSGPHLCPRDMIDIQSFLWVQGSDEYE